MQDAWCFFVFLDGLAVCLPHPALLHNVIQNKRAHQALLLYFYLTLSVIPHQIVSSLPDGNHSSVRVHCQPFLFPVLGRFLSASPSSQLLDCFWLSSVCSTCIHSTQNLLPACSVIVSDIVSLQTVFVNFFYVLLPDVGKSGSESKTLPSFFFILFT